MYNYDGTHQYILAMAPLFMIIFSNKKHPHWITHPLQHITRANLGD